MIEMKFFAALFLPALVCAAILPDEIGAYHRTGTAPVAVTDRPVWQEYGLQASESATYRNDAEPLAGRQTASGGAAPVKERVARSQRVTGEQFTVSAWQLQDTTGALGAFDWQRPADATASKAAAMAAETRKSLLLVCGNYLLRFDGHQPSKEELDALTGSLKNVDATSLPVLPGYLPSGSLVPNSERYVTGPAALAKFDAGIPPSVAAFHFGSEAQIGVFHSTKGDLTMAIFNYPSPQIAMQQLPDFEKLPGAMAKRTGPLIAVVLSPADADFAEQLLGQVRFQASITRDEYVPTRRDNIGVLLMNIFVLIGILGAFSIVTGLFVGGFRTWLRRGRKGEEPDPMISLHLER